MTGTEDYATAESAPMFRDIGPRLVWGGFVHNEGGTEWAGNRIQPSP